MKETVAIFGGTFDPPHEGHSYILKSLINQGFDRIVLATTGKNPFKDRTPASFATRLKMWKLVLSYENLPVAAGPGEKGIFISDFPYEYTVDFVSYYKKLDPERDIIWVVGEDLKDEYRLWRDWDKIKIKVKVMADYQGFRSSLVRGSHIAAHAALHEFIKESKLYCT
jgi:nicotinate-nucleotide adenylyltransferase